MSQASLALSHVYPAGSCVNRRGHLEVGGCDALDLVEEFGSPVYVVAEEDLRARARAFREAFAARHEDFDVLFGSKAFPCGAVCRALAEEGLACDVASGGELHLALRAGFDPARIHLHGNAKSEAELREAIRAGVGHVVLDSFDDLERLERIAEQAGIRQPVLLRVTPGVAGDTHHAISTGQSDSKFGFSIEETPRAIERSRAARALELVGLHCHIGSQLLELEPFRRAVETLARLGDFPVYNLGGGLGVAYTSAQRPPAIEEYVEAVVGGMSDNLRPMLYGASYEAVLADRPLAEGGELCRLAGKHCESGDVLVREVRLADPAPGDVIAVPVTGAYCHALANNYNSVPRPPVVFCRQGSARLVVRRETYEDLVARDVG